MTLSSDFIAGVVVGYLAAVVPVIAWLSVMLTLEARKRARLQRSAPRQSWGLAPQPTPSDLEETRR